MPSAPTVSVVVPAHRLDDWLRRAVDSVLAAHDVPLELIVVLDGIEDADPEWGTDPRVRLVLRPVNGGPAAAMQDGLDVALGRYVARLDSDDLSDVGRFAVQAAYLDAHPETVAVSSLARLIDEDDRPTGRIAAPTGADVRRSLLLYNGIAHSTLMFRHAAGVRAGGYDPALRLMEDYDFILRLATLGPIAQLDDELVGYRLHARQASRAIPLRGPHIDAVIRGRRELGAALGVHPVSRWARDLAWAGVRHWRKLTGRRQIARTRSGA